MNKIYDEDDQNEFVTHFSEKAGSEEDRDKKHEHLPKKTGEMHIVVNHKRLFAGIILFLVVLMGVTGWQLGYFTKLTNTYNAASISITVVEKDTHKAITNASVKVGDKTSVTDIQGTARIDGVLSGQVTVLVSKDGYVQKSYSTTVYRGVNPLSDVVLEKAPEKVYALNVTVRDAVSGLGLKNAKVIVGDKTVLTDVAGIAAFQLQSGATLVKVTNEGYINQDANIQFNNDAYSPVVFDIIPLAYVVFEQEKGGKTDLYLVDLSGGEPSRLTDGKGVSSNFQPLPSPDQKYLAFLTDRDGAKSQGSVANRLYVLDDKSVVAKTTDDINPNAVRWLNNTTIMYSAVITAENVTPSHVGVVAYNVVSKKRTLLSEGAKSGFGGSVDAIASSQDGQMIIYHQLVHDVNGVLSADLTGIYSVKPDGKARKKISSSSKAIHDLYTSFDSKTVFYVYVDSPTEYVYYQIDLSNNSETLATTKKTIRERAFTQSESKTSQLRSLTLVTSDVKKYVYIDTKNGKSDVFVSSIDGSLETQLTNIGTIQALALSSNDAYVLAIAVEGSVKSIYVTGLLGGTPKKLAEGYSTNAYFSFKPEAARQ